ncbi:Fe-S cluster assembly protein SufD [Kribbella deserti]|uniref:Fe-S cluster assembly protein SufD n=1 Tax=Kribbella deserti TaxID=1926257 RepID=A0ABV6QKY8_9ACTN
MSATETLVATGNKGHSHGAGSEVPLQTRSERVASYDVADFAVPHGREEEWRFTPVKLLKGLFADEPGTESVKVDVQAPAGVTVETVAADAVLAGKPQDRAAVVAWAHAEKAVAVRVPADAELTEAVHVNVAGLGGRGYSHLIVDAGRHSRATVIIDHSGAGEFGGNVEIVVGDGAELRVVSIQSGDSESIHLAQHDAKVGRDAKLNHVVVTLGGKLVRVSTNVMYAGPGGDAELLGVYFPETGQHHEHRLFVDHEATNCKSNVLYKGALAGESARSVWIGDVLIRAAAEGTDTFELNRNLVLTDGARADSVPNLEIETGEIEGAGHASATGRFDDEQLFYLQARGIPEDEARRLVVSGFFNDIIGRIGVPEVIERLHEVIEQKLARAATLSAEASAGAGQR